MTSLLTYTNGIIAFLFMLAMWILRMVVKRKAPQDTRLSNKIENTREKEAKTAGEAAQAEAKKDPAVIAKDFDKL